MTDRAPGPVVYHRQDVLDYAADADRFADGLRDSTAAHVAAAGQLQVGGTGGYAHSELAFVSGLHARLAEAHRQTTADLNTLIDGLRRSAQLARAAVDHYDRAGDDETGLAERFRAIIAAGPAVPAGGALGPTGGTHGPAGGAR